MKVESLKVLISLSGMSQRELAAASGMSESQCSEYLSGAVPIGPTAIAQFARGLRVDPTLLARAESVSLEKVRSDVLAKLSEDPIDVELVDDDPAPSPKPPTRRPKHKR